MSDSTNAITSSPQRGRIRWSLVMVFSCLLVLIGLGWRLAGEYRRQIQKRSDPLSRLVVIGTRSSPGDPEKTTSLHVMLRNISPASYREVTLAVSSHAPGKPRWEGTRSFPVEIASGATVLLPEWELPVEQVLGSTFECRVAGAK